MNRHPRSSPASSRSQIRIKPRRTCTGLTAAGSKGPASTSKKKSVPEAAFPEGLAKARDLTRKADFAAALKECDAAAKEAGDAADIVAAFRECVAGGADLRKLIVADAARKKPSVYVDFAGRPTRMKLVAANDSGGEFSFRGTAVPLKWRQISPRRFYGIAAKFVPDTPAGHLMLGSYAAAAGLEEEAAESLAKAAQDAKLRGAAERAKLLVK